MKKKSKKRGGFSLVEVVLSMALIAILSIGVYNVYLILIRQTKDGQVKQGAALAGKKIVEEVKAGEFEKDDDDNLMLKIDNSDITLKKSESEERYEISNQNLDGYEYVISIQPKKTVDSKSNIVITNEDYGEHKYILIDNTMITDNILKLSISSSGDIKEPYSFNIDSKSIVLDFKNYNDIDNITVEVTNKFSKTLKLYILNSKFNTSNERNVVVKNIEGSLNEYYRYDNEGKSGTLYNITVTVSGRNSRGQKVDNLFQSSFVQNIDTN